MNNFSDLLYDFSDSNISDDTLNTLVSKITSVLNDDERNIIESVSSKLLNAKVKTTYVDLYPEITSQDLNDIMKKEIWDDSDEWAHEMYAISDGIMSNLDELESNNFKQLIKALKEK